MKKETIFTSDDGIRFDTEEGCLEWERLLPTFREMRQEIVEELVHESSATDSDYVTTYSYDLEGDLREWMGLAKPLSQDHSVELLGRCRQIIEMTDRLRRPQ